MFRIDICRRHGRELLLQILLRCGFVFVLWLESEEGTEIFQCPEGLAVLINVKTVHQ